jgi:hypothetical protein
VVVATHVGTPFKNASIWPALPCVVVAKLPDPFPYKSDPACTAAQPVPPFATCKMPVTSVARFTSAVDTVPAVALSIPVRLPSEKFEAKRLVDEAVVAKLVVVVAFVVVERTIVPFDTKRFVVDAVTAYRFVVVALLPEKFCNVVEPDTMRPLAANTPVAVAFPTNKRVAKALVDEAIEANNDVEVALVTVAFAAVTLPVTVRFPSTVDDACDMNPDGRRTVTEVVGAR